MWSCQSRVAAFSCDLIFMRFSCPLSTSPTFKNEKSFRESWSPGLFFTFQVVRKSLVFLRLRTSHSQNGYEVPPSCLFDIGSGWQDRLTGRPATINARQALLGSRRLKALPQPYSTRAVRIRSSNDGACTETCRRGDSAEGSHRELSRPACFSISPQTSHHTCYKPSHPRKWDCASMLQEGGKLRTDSVRICSGPLTSSLPHSLMPLRLHTTRPSPGGISVSCSGAVDLASKRNKMVTGRFGTRTSHTNSPRGKHASISLRKELPPLQSSCSSLRYTTSGPSGPSRASGALGLARGTPGHAASAKLGHCPFRTSKSALACSRSVLQAVECAANLPESHVRRKLTLHIDRCWAVPGINPKISPPLPWSRSCKDSLKLVFEVRLRFAGRHIAEGLSPLPAQEPVPPQSFD